jgi:hypothetical protein
VTTALGACGNMASAMQVEARAMRMGTLLRGLTSP